MQAQIRSGIHGLTLITDLSFATPKNELANSYSLGEAMKFYLDGSLSVLQIGYGNNSPVSFNASAFLGHEKANFDAADYVSNGLDAKITSYGFRLKPFEVRNINDVYNAHTYKDGDALNGTTQTEAEHQNNRVYHAQLLTMILGGLFFEVGSSSAKLIEEGYDDVKRHPFVIGYGLAPAIPLGSKTNFIFEFAFRKYNWINGMNTTSTISTFRTGIGLQFNF